ncbi:MAG TPA: hypothetical protein VHE79_06375 [Spirochaetia bacterium]
MKNPEDWTSLGTATRAAAPPAGTIHRTIELLRTALDDLGASMPLMEVERVGFMVNEAMSAQARSFHTPSHVFDLVDPGNPHSTLAALFHDLVYFQVDQGFNERIAECVAPCLEQKDGELWLRADLPSTDRLLAIALRLFGFWPGDRLVPTAGMNEFLSALVMLRTLGVAVRETDLALATGCIEMTIPFRGPDSRGRAPAERLAEKMARANADLDLGLTPAAIEEGVRWATLFANRDVANFAEEDVGRFLDNTWKLLPESNPALRTQGVYSIRSYRRALQGMEGFLRTLDPRTVFGSYGGVPSVEDYTRREERARRNITVSRDYLGVKLLAAAVLEALAEMRGGDAPVAYFMGDIDVKEKGGTLEDYLPARATATASLDPTLHDLLALGRASSSRFDLQNSPLALFVAEGLGTDGIAEGLAAARRLFAGEATAREFLECLPGELVADIAEACSFMAFARHDTLMAYARGRRGRGD